MPIPEHLKKTAILVLAGGLALGAGLYFGLDSRTAPPAPNAEAALENVVFRDLEGKAYRLADWRGKALLLNFWATWCGPCVEEMPLLERWQQEKGAQGIQIVGIALDSAENVAKFREKAGISFPLLLGDAKLLGEMKNLGNTAGGLPFSLFLDSEGRIVENHIGALDEEKLQKTLQILQPSL